jgi:hypothetical protein
MSFKTTTALLLCAALAGPALAQNPDLGADEGCGTRLRLEDIPLMRLREALGLYDEPLAMAAQEYTIPLTIHVIRRTDGTQGLSQDRVDQAIADANAIWAPADMQFCQWGPTRYIDSDDLWWWLDDFEQDVVRTIDVVPDTINVYFCPAFEWCGRGSFTSSPVQGVLVANGCAGTDRNPSTFGHELGHYFDLYHTHEDAFGVECADGSNCADSGDLLCDTPADPNLSDLVGPGCVYVGPADGPCPDDAAYDPDPHNVMSYSAKRCRDFMSPQQIARARATLVNLRPELLDLGDCSAAAACGAGAGDCFAPHGTAGCEDELCCALVCALDDYCCTNEWDVICVNEASNLCVTGDDCDRSIAVSEGTVPLVTLSDNTGTVDDSSCASGDEVDEWYDYTASCSGQATAYICTEFTSVDITLSVFDACNGNEIACSHEDPECSLGSDLNARVSWAAISGSTYAIRVSAVDATPGNNFTGNLVIDVACCGSELAGDCFAANGTPYCENPACCQAVCAAEPYCCDTEWDSTCALAAEFICLTCGGAGAGDCFVANGSPGCERTECCSDVCAADPYCCNVNWDDLCVNEAYEFCSLLAFNQAHIPLGGAELTAIPGGDVWVHPIGSGGADGVAILAGGLPAAADDADPVTSADIAMAPDAWPATAYVLLGASTTIVPPDVPVGLLQVVHGAAGVINIYAGLLGPQTYTVQLYDDSGMIDEETNVEGPLVGQALPATESPRGLGAAVVSGELVQWVEWHTDMLMAIPGHDPVTGRKVVVTSEYSGSPDDSATGYLSTISITGAGIDGIRIMNEEVRDCPWDCGDQDGTVGIVDFLAILAQWGAPGTCDFDFDGAVGILDFLQLLGNWGPCP